MGSAFGIRTFETDDATEWLDRFTADPSTAELRRALELGEHPSLLDSRVALAAAEIVAAWCGRAAPEIPPAVTAWLLGRTAAVSERALNLARAAVDRVIQDSDLSDSWEQWGEAPAWRSAVQDLRERLG